MARRLVFAESHGVRPTATSAATINFRPFVSTHSIHPVASRASQLEMMRAYTCRLAPRGRRLSSATVAARFTVEAAPHARRTLPPPAAGADQPSQRPAIRAPHPLGDQAGRGAYALKLSGLA